jgi:hypothetical protein
MAFLVGGCTVTTRSTLVPPWHGTSMSPESGAQATGKGTAVLLSLLPLLLLLLEVRLWYSSASEARARVATSFTSVRDSVPAAQGRQ